ncbi:MAG TPA: substrate-binding domain-containing protein [Spirochaetota bacterium]|nr:substrate-binding domain-containing protein [Spirochaetota bacterium]HPV41358.1 substrate-binding domain-containing protein [Spirochaetota bacterium]
MYNLTACLLSVFASLLLVIIPADARQKDIIFATTTSTQDTGLLDELIPVFEKKSGFRVKTIAVGSGQAMAMGEKGEADVLLVHSRDAEEKFVKQGLGINRRIVMHNDFVVLGPKEDPAKIKGLKTAADAFKKIAASKSLFVSRGDKSGTHVMEQKLWKKAGLNPEKDKWYQQTGLGMGQTLAVVVEKRGYTLCDRATYLSRKNKIDAAVLVEGDAALLNIYHVIEVNPKRFPRVNAEGGKAFADFWVAPDTQMMIKDFGIRKYGAILFHPDAVK